MIFQLRSETCYEEVEMKTDEQLRLTVWTLLAEFREMDVYYVV